MKKAISTLALAFGLSAAATAAVKVGSVAPNFQLTDIDGQSHNLYNYLDSGYTVIIDVSAAWCGPCWNVHKSHVFENLVDHYGKNGSITPGKIKVLFIEGEGTNTIAQIRGTTTANTYAGFTQGDWTAGTNYPIIDDVSQNGTYLYGGFPSFTIICPDRFVKYVGSGYSNAMLTEKFWLDISNNSCPNYAPSVTVDAKTIPYDGASTFYCDATPKVSFQNYSKTQHITSATVKVFNGNTQVASTNWTGDLAPFAIASVSLPAFTGSSLGPYRYEVTTAGDSYPANDKSADSLFKVYSASTATATPWSENFETSTTDAMLPYAMTASNTAAVTTETVVGSNDKPSRALKFKNGFYSTVDLILGNFNTGSATNVAIDFDYSYAQISGFESDQLEIQVSNDCGTTWNPMWALAGDKLATVDPTYEEFKPSSAKQWKHANVLLSEFKGSNMLVKLMGISNSGNYAWVDNIRITNTLNVNNVIASAGVKMYPNPAKESTALEFSLMKSNKVTVSVIDALGRTVSTIANGNMAQGQHRLVIPTATLAAGVYTVNVVTEEGSLTQRLSVVK